uniref:J domain-containing protein n=1 Tax=Corethron hystrix TaxID=216773 RepID=A0A7S1BVN7_9STRA|mmetsp:Transcript_40563/g.95240  ORF Transcript_40563/g.95240 Transcript_40563/m.95240 type:complete len:326 (+) Transcript_40563:99-1076(+)
MSPSPRKSKRSDSRDSDNGSSARKHPPENSDPITVSSDPYEVLGVSRDASQDEIKSAYRKLALKNHPDKAAQHGRTAEEATARFSAIGAAYETVGDAKARKEYDAGLRRDMGGGGQEHPDFGGFHHSHHDLFSHFSAHDGFTDPFELFERVFQEVHEQHFGGFPQQQQRRQSQRRSSDPFDDPFFQSSGFGIGGVSSIIGGGSMFGGGMFGGMDMNRMMANAQRDASFGSTSYGGGGRTTESVSTSTRIVNGKRQTVTKRTVVHSDGRKETTTEVSGDENFPEQYRIQDNNDGRQQRRRITGSSNGNTERENSDRRQSSSRRGWW